MIKKVLALRDRSFSSLKARAFLYENKKGRILVGDYYGNIGFIRQRQAKNR